MRVWEVKSDQGETFPLALIHAGIQHGKSTYSTIKQNEVMSSAATSMDLEMVILSEVT